MASLHKKGLAGGAALQTLLPALTLEVTAYLECVNIEVKSAVAVNLRAGGEVVHSTKAGRGQGASGAVFFDEIFPSPQRRG